MTIRQFIFSNKGKHRVARHVAVWIGFCLFCFYTNIEIDSLHDLKVAMTYEVSLMRIVCFLPMYIFTAYIFSYVLVQQFIQKKRYFYFAIFAIATFLFCFVFNFFSADVFVHFAYRKLPAFKLNIWDFIIDWNMSVQRDIGVAGGAIAITLGRGWYLQQMENNRLAKQEAENKTWLFKSQVQPEFIFHSLQSLHKKIYTSSDEASLMILQLSDIFNYILYECNNTYVLLEKELILLEQFVAMEKLDGQNKPIIFLNITGNCNNKYIVPLALFSFLRKLADNKHDDNHIIVSIDIKDTVIVLSVQMERLFSDIYESAIIDTAKKNNLGAQTNNNTRMSNYMEETIIELAQGSNAEREPVMLKSLAE